MRIGDASFYFLYCAELFGPRRKDFSGLLRCVPERNVLNVEQLDGQEPEAGKNGVLGSRKRIYLSVEFAVLFIVLPLLYADFRHALRPVPAIWCFAAFSAYVLSRDGYSDEEPFTS